MDDLTQMLSKVLSDPEAMQQIQAVAASLGLTGGASASGDPAARPEPDSAEQPAEGGEPDLSALASLPGGAPAAGPGNADLSALTSLLGGAGGTAQPAQAAPDLSALAGLLGGAAQGGRQNTGDGAGLSSLLGGIMGKQQSSGGADVSALTALLKAGQPPQSQNTENGAPFDMSMLLRLQQAMSTLTANRANAELLMALKPRLKPERSKKVDDAVRVMQLIQFLPLIKETGLFGDIDQFLGGLGLGLGEGGGGLGGLVGNLFGGRRGS